MKEFQKYFILDKTKFSIFLKMSFNNKIQKAKLNLKTSFGKKYLEVNNT